LPKIDDGAQQAASQSKVVPASPIPAASAIRLTVSFKLDPRLSGGTYGGEHWVSPATFTSAVQEGKEATIDAIVKGLDSRGAPLRIGPSWTAEDPSMVAVSPVSPGEIDHVQITVKHVGETKLTIAASGSSKVLRIKATSAANNRGLQVTISQ
jgi:hypothetical protein